MGTHPMLVPDSTVRLVYEALSAGDVMTQVRLCARTGRTRGSVCKALKMLVDEGYAKRVGKTVNQHGRSVGKPSLQFAKTGKVWRPEEGYPVPAALELAAVMNEIVRRGLRRKGG